MPQRQLCVHKWHMATPTPDVCQDCSQLPDPLPPPPPPRPTLNDSSCILIRKVSTGMGCTRLSTMCSIALPIERMSTVQGVKRREARESVAGCMNSIRWAAQVVHHVRHCIADRANIDCAGSEKKGGEGECGRVCEQHEVGCTRLSTMCSIALLMERMSTAQEVEGMDARKSVAGCVNSTRWAVPGCSLALPMEQMSTAQGMQALQMFC